MTAKQTVAGEQPVTLNVSLLGREFKVVCKESEQDELEAAVAYVEAQMRGIRDAGKVTAVDRVAVMTALNIAHELLRERRSQHGTESARTNVPLAIDDAAARGRIHSMQSAVDAVLVDAKRAPDSASEPGFAE